MRVIFEHMQQIAPNTYSFYFIPLKTCDFIAGQFTQLHLPHKNMDNRGDKRWFTISSSPSDNFISITTKMSGKHSSSFKKTLNVLTPGTELNLADPMGDFVLPQDASIPLLFIAGGLGITPMHSMIKFLEDNQQTRDIHLVHSVTMHEDLLWHDFFSSANIKFTPIVNQPSKDWKGETGILSARRITFLISQKSRELIYLAGPENMIEQFVEELPPLGIRKNHLVTDYFPGYSGI